MATVQDLRDFLEEVPGNTVVKLVVADTGCDPSANFTTLNLDNFEHIEQIGNILYLGEIT